MAKSSRPAKSALLKADVGLNKAHAELTKIAKKVDDDALKKRILNVAATIHESQM
jgi:hypothetical protein